jgi:hypothetical protein
MFKEKTKATAAVSLHNSNCYSPAGIWNNVAVREEMLRIQASVQDWLLSVCRLLIPAWKAGRGA